MAISTSTVFLFCSVILQQVNLTPAFQATPSSVLKSITFLTRNSYSQPAVVVSRNTQNENGKGSRVSSSSSSSSSRLQMGIDVDECEDIGFSVSLNKPLGLVFGENPNPYFGVGIDDVAEGLNGGKAGLRVGDQLLAVNGNVVVGKDFDTILGMLQDGPTNLDLVLYRGTVSMVFGILSNRMGVDDVSVAELDEEDDDDGIPAILADDYEPPVIEFEEEKPLTAGDVFKAFGKIGSMIMSSDEEEKEKPKPEKKKNTGFFGIGGDSIQLDGDDATGTGMK